MFTYNISCIGYSIPGHSIWKRMPRGEAEMHSFSYSNDQILHNQFSQYFLCRVSWLPIITNLGSLSQVRLNEYQLKSSSKRNKISQSCVKIVKLQIKKILVFVFARQGLSGPYQIRSSSSSDMDLGSPDMDLIILVLRKKILIINIYWELWMCT